MCVRVEPPDIERHTWRACSTWHNLKAFKADYAGACTNTQARHQSQHMSVPIGKPGSRSCWLELVQLLVQHESTPSLQVAPHGDQQAANNYLLIRSMLLHSVQLKPADFSSGGMQFHACGRSAGMTTCTALRSGNTQVKVLYMMQTVVYCVAYCTKPRRTRACKKHATLSNTNTKLHQQQVTIKANATARFLRGGPVLTAS
jgi:hypothetical protein